MKIQKFHLVTVGVVVVLVTVIVITTTVPGSTSYYSQLVLPDHLNPSHCPAEYGSPRPVILVSLDGFRPDYLQRNLTPTLSHLSELGVHAPYLLPVYPTKTFTNHYSIVTGLYPESHGIVDNVFYDPTFRALFTVGSAAANNGSWWGGEPIWNTLTRQGKKSSSFFWPGSEADIGGRHPTEWIPYNKTISYDQRVSQVLMWVSLPPEKRPSWVSLYLDEPDRQGHATGPLSSEIDKKLEEVEEAVRGLVRGLATRELLNCVNILLVSDHGMAQAKVDADIDLATSVPNISQLANVIYGPSPMIIMKDPSFEAEVELVTRLSNDFEGKLRAFLKVDLPKRFHYTNNGRISNIVLDLQPGYRVKDVRPSTQQRPPAKGFHGYDYVYQDMAAFFIGYGPDLAQHKTVEAFQNTELYNLMCQLTGVKPSPNNGTWGALHHLLAAPPPLSAPTNLVNPIPLENTQEKDTYEVAEGCVADPSWTGRKKPAEEEKESYEDIPWGPPSTSGGVPSPSLLLHHTHVTGYSEELKVPLWTSFTIGDTWKATNLTVKSPWIADPRLLPSQAPTCLQYDAHPNTTMTPLFPPQYGRPQVPEEAYYISNSVAVSERGQGSGSGIGERWRHLTQDMLPRWLTLNGPLNVVLGPVFDYNHDGVLDHLAHTGSVQVPSDLFAVVTRCLDKVTSLSSCGHDRLDALAFVYPQTQHSWTRASGDNRSFAAKYTARVRDVEQLTNLTFFPKLSLKSRLPIVLRIHRSIWRLL